MPTTPTAARPSLTDAQVARFWRDGYLFPMPVLSEGAARELGRELLALQADGLDDHAYPWNQKVELLLPAVDALVRDRRLTDHVAAVLGEDLLVLSADVFIKDAQSTKRITWHQDVNFWELEPFDLLTAWVACTPAHPDNGGMQYGRGGHRGRIEHIEHPGGDNMLSRGQELAVRVAAEDVADVVLAPGEASFHHALTPHASGPNRTDAPRIGVAIRYTTPRVRQLAGPPLTARLARGQDDVGHFPLADGPEAPCSADALAAHAAALEPHRATGFSTA